MYDEAAYRRDERIKESNPVYGLRPGLGVGESNFLSQPTGGSGAEDCLLGGLLKRAYDNGVELCGRHAIHYQGGHVTAGLRLQEGKPLLHRSSIWRLPERCCHYIAESRLQVGRGQLLGRERG
jgi:hypothetical protein